MRRLAAMRLVAEAVPVVGQQEALDRRQQDLGRMRERRVTDIMEQPGETRDPPGMVEISRRTAGEAGAQAGEARPGQVHNAQAVLEAVMDRAGVDQVDEAQLADVAQALDPRVVDDQAFDIVDDDGAVDRVADLVGGHHGPWAFVAGRGRFRKHMLRIG